MKRVIASEQSAKSKYTLQLDGNDIQLMRVAVSELIPRVSDDAADRLRTIDYQLKALLSSGPSDSGSSESRRLEDVYKIDEHAVELLLEAQHNLDSEPGYQAYYELAKYLHETNQSADVLYDLAADFAWDDRLSDAVARLAQADGYDKVPDWA